MKKIFSRIDGFFFARISARGFSLMRIAWAAVTLLFLLMQWNDIVAYHADTGMFSTDLIPAFARTDLRFTILDHVTAPTAVFSLYLALLASLTCAMIGFLPRISTIVAALLLFSFHEDNPTILGGGDTLLRGIGFLLMIAPGIDGLSVSRLRAQRKRWRTTGALLPAPTMPIWPWRLLLWQMIVIYGTSLWYKLLGTMWLDGTAVETVMHHPIYARFPAHVMNMMLPVLGIGNFATLLFEAAWLLLLIPNAWTDALPTRFLRIPLRRILLIAGVLFHGGIFLLLDAGTFSLAIFAAYVGLLRAEDFAFFFGMRKKKRPIVVLFDGTCGLCRESTFALQLLDSFSRLRLVDFRDQTAREKEAPGITEKTLDKAMHIKLPDGSYLTGFDAFRRIAHELPGLFVTLPFLHLPGIAPIGRRIYARIADRRKRCNHESCGI